MQNYDAIVIGGGFYGSYLACSLRSRLGRVLLVERESELLRRASYANQARVHNGYHYPRSVLTGLRSRLNFPRFVEEFRDCIDDSFQMYYAVARQHSKVTAQQFIGFCRRIGAPLEPAPAAVAALFDPGLIEAAFATVEHGFDAVKLRARMLERLETAGVEVRLQTEATSARPGLRGLDVTLSSGGDTEVATTPWAFNCTYANINHVLGGSDRPLVPLKHELTEMALVEVPAALRHVGVTVMCGPFFSIMPFPARGLHTLSHVRYTPHGSWEERTERPFTGAVHSADFVCKTAYPRMIRDVQRYMPALSDCRQVDSLWEIKTVLPQSESDDSRPILFRPDAAMPGLISIMGGKIDNVYDLERELLQTLGAVGQEVAA